MARDVLRNPLLSTLNSSSQFSVLSGVLSHDISSHSSRLSEISDFFLVDLRVQI